jgi:hypothetical protein
MSGSSGSTPPPGSSRPEAPWLPASVHVWGVYARDRQVWVRDTRTGDRARRTRKRYDVRFRVDGFEFRVMKGRRGDRPAAPRGRNRDRFRDGLVTGLSDASRRKGPPVATRENLLVAGKSQVSRRFPPPAPLSRHVAGWLSATLARKRTPVRIRSAPLLLLGKQCSLLVALFALVDRWRWRPPWALMVRRWAGVGDFAGLGGQAEPRASAPPAPCGLRWPPSRSS